MLKVKIDKLDKLLQYCEETKKYLFDFSPYCDIDERQISEEKGKSEMLEKIIDKIKEIKGD